MSTMFDSDQGPVSAPGDLAGLADLGGFSGLGGCERDRAYLAVEGEIRRLQVLQAAMLFEVQRSCSFVDDFHHNATCWVRAVTNSSRGTAIRKVQTARLLADLPGLAAAVAAGQVGDDQVGLLRRLYSNDRCRDQLAGSEELLVECARTLTCREFALVCQRWQAHADPDGAHADHDASRHNRHVQSSPVGAGHRLHAEGDGLTGEMISEILDAHADTEFDDDVSQRARRYGDDADRYPLARTARQRRYDALVAIFLKATGTTASTDRVPLVNIVCTETVLADAISDFFATGANYTGANPAARADPARSQRLRLCETVAGVPVDPHDLVVAALIGQLRRVVVDSAGRVIDLGRRRRLFVGAARDAVLLTGDRCCHPGCELRIARIQIDHLDSWAARAGPTNPFNGGPLCPAHNRAKQHGQLTITRNHTGWHHHRPDGTEITPRGQ